MQPSPKYSLNQQDLVKWAHNALVFLAPALIVLIASVVKAIPSDWQYGALVLYILNVLADLLRKYVAGS